MLDNLTTEARNPASESLDQLSTTEIVHLINAEDAKVAPAVADQAEAISEAIDVVASRVSAGGRLVYFGAGTSGRLGVLDAAECPPTFNSDPGQVIGLIAGGAPALTHAIEGAEDQATLGAVDLQSVNLGSKDVAVGIATSGRTPYVLGGLRHAASVGAFRIGIACNRDAELRPLCDLNITPVVGPEILSGSTRMKAGTATKLVLNTLSTGVMIKLGKTFGNQMVDLRATNSKLLSRAKRIVAQTTRLNEADATALLEACGGEVKTAILSSRSRLDPAVARRALSEHGGHLQRALAAVTVRHD